MSTKRKSSIFCEKNPGAMIGDAAVFIGGVWVLCKGRRYYGGYLKYWHNGKEGKVAHHKWVNLEGLRFSKERKIAEVSGMNIGTLKAKHPRIYCGDHNHFAFYEPEDEAIHA
jgi:hypothetical protein